MRTNRMFGRNKLIFSLIMGLMVGIMTGINPATAISQSATSASGTAIPPASQIVDSQNNIWTLSSSNSVLENGKAAGYTNNVALILYYNGAVYQENTTGGWWSWTNGAWLASSDPISSNLSVIVSLNGTTIPPASQIVDSQNNIWTLSSSNSVLENGKAAGYTNNVALVLYYNGAVYQENTAGGWWSWTNGAWLASSDPISAVSGVCGSANGTSLSSAPTTNLCSSGTSTALSGSGPWSWNCDGIKGGNNTSCSASLLPDVVASASGTTIPSSARIIDSQDNVWTLSSSNTALENGKAAGYTNNVALILYYNGAVYQENTAGGWWSWTGGAWSNSSDPRSSGSGLCGSANGVEISSAPTFNLCTSGTASTVTGNGTLWSWTCNAVSCSAPVKPSAVNGACGISNGVAFSSAPTTNLCGNGVPTAVSGNGPWTWECDGTSGGSDASCLAPLLQSASASGTTIPSALQILDSQKNTWMLSSSSTVLMNGNPAGYTNNVSLILYYNGVIYQENASGAWWSWTNGVWVPASDPRSGVCGTSNGVAVSGAPSTNLCSSGVTSAVIGSGPWSWSCAGSNGTTAQCSAPSTASLNDLFGVNLSSAEFGQNFPGTYGVDYTYPTSSELAYYKSKGLTLIRIPFAWERMQPTLNAALDTAQVGYMTNFLNAADTLGMSVILDVHDYGRYGTGTFSDFTTHGNIIGSTQVPVSAFANLWSQLAAQFKGHPSLLGYDIMNEPHDMGGASVWPTAAQAAVNAIRAVDTTHQIFVEGDGWAGAWSWMTYNANLNINDPSGHLVYEAHQYFDSDHSGTYTSSYDAEGAYPTVGVVDLQPFATWLTQNGYKGWLGEYGVPNNDSRWLTVLNNFLAALKSDGIWGTYWAGGPWWGTYPLSCEPTSGQDAVQMNILESYPSA